MNAAVEKLSQAARYAAQQKNWSQVKVCARDILNRRRDCAEGYFLLGLAEKESGRSEAANKAFKRAIASDGSRYDAAVELAGLLIRENKCGPAVELIQQFEQEMQNSPRYLDLAATIYVDAGLADRAWPLYRQAIHLQPGVDSLLAKFAACCVYVGKIEEAREIYLGLLEKAPSHQRNHYELSRLSAAKDSVHIDQIRAILKPADKDNVYANYALGKECEDLCLWNEAFMHYKQAGDAAAALANYDVETDIATIDQVIATCDKRWLADRDGHHSGDTGAKMPIFIVGLPRSGTTLVERILSSHTDIESVGETFFIQEAIRDVSRVVGGATMSPEIISTAAAKTIDRIADGYRSAVAYRFGDKPVFVEKLPENFLYLGFIAKAFPAAKIIHVSRNPMDSCFALFKQSFFRYAYDLDDLGRYYEAYWRLSKHWNDVLSSRVVAVSYDRLVADQDVETRLLFDSIGISFQESCIKFENNQLVSNTASSVQIREKIHSRSVGKWKRFESQLRSLTERLQDLGLDLN